MGTRTKRQLFSLMRPSANKSLDDLLADVRPGQRAPLQNTN